MEQLEENLAAHAAEVKWAEGETHDAVRQIWERLDSGSVSPNMPLLAQSVPGLAPKMPMLAQPVPQLGPIPPIRLESVSTMPD